MTNIHTAAYLQFLTDALNQGLEVSPYTSLPMKTNDGLLFGYYVNGKSGSAHISQEVQAVLDDPESFGRLIGEGSRPSIETLIMNGSLKLVVTRTTTGFEMHDASKQYRMELNARGNLVSSDGEDNSLDGHYSTVIGNLMSMCL